MRERALWTKSLFAAALILHPFGSVPELLSRKNPWHGFAELPSNPLVLVAVRAEEIPGADCASYLSTARKLPLEGRVGADFGAWEPWEEDERDQVASCASTPCDIKLDRAEAWALRELPKERRFREFEALVSGRVRKYFSSGMLRGYEFPGTPNDPIKDFGEVGLESGLKLSSEGKPIFRHVNFGRGPIKPTRQVLDRWSAGSADDAVTAARDIYSNHYFDSWGELLDVKCREGRVRVLAALAVEVDIFKKHDLLSVISRGRIRNGMDGVTADFLDRWVGRLKAMARK